MSRELLDHDPMTGMSTWFEVDESQKKFHIHTTQDVTDFIEKNKLLQNAPDYKKAGIKAGWQHVAHIPDVVVHKWMREGINVFNPDHKDAVLRKLRDPEYRHLRTTLGAI
jgi:hypothetical protein